MASHNADSVRVIYVTVPCPHCEGFGAISQGCFASEACPDCDGKGHVKVTHNGRSGAGDDG